MGKSYIINSKDNKFIRNVIEDLLLKLNIINLKSTSDYYEIAPLKDKSNISIEQMKELKTWSNSKPFSSSSKLAVIFEADRLTEQAQNSILKLLEEPNKYTSFILVSVNTDKLLKTIISRCELIIDNAENSLEYNIDEFINLDFLGRIEYVKELSLIKDIKIRNERIEDFLLALAQYYRRELRSGKNINNKSEAINNCRKYISANVSVKNSLINLILELDKS